jgi:hypothetical protein
MLDQKSCRDYRSVEMVVCIRSHSVRNATCEGRIFYRAMHSIRNACNLSYNINI